MKNIEQFCSDHSACQESREWALANCKDMQQAWSTAKPTWLIWIATRPGVLTERELRLFAVWCARQVQHLLTDPRSIKAIDVAERYANGEATKEELDVAWAAACDAACEAARGATRDAARAAAWAAAWAAACAAAWAAARDAARAAAWAEDRAAARDAQAEWLQNNTQPNFN